MPMARLEHVNFTAPDPLATAEMLCQLFDWKIRWKGPSLHGGYSVHVGDDNAYIAVYSPERKPGPKGNHYGMTGGMNHIGVVVDDLELAEQRVREMGFEPHSHADYEPGRRFYFNDRDDIEFEVVSYP